MLWNWQQKNWPDWRFDAESLVAMEQRFLLGAGRLSGSWEHLTREDKDRIQISLLIDEALKTSLIEGEILDRSSVRSSIRQQFGLPGTVQSRPAESGIAELMVACFEHFGQPLTDQTLFEWHQLVCRGANDIGPVGKYRTGHDVMQVVSGPMQKRVVHFEAPPSQIVKREMQIFIEWFEACRLPALTKAGLAHLYFVSIHPFEDGNGRIARALSEKCLAQAIGQPSLLALSRQIEMDRKLYYVNIEANNKGMDITSWIAWFAGTVLKAQDYSIAIIDHLIAKTKLFDALRGQLNLRQERALIRMFDAGPDGFEGGLSARNYITIADTTTATATRDLFDLVKKGALSRTGTLKSTRYWLKI